MADLNAIRASIATGAMHKGQKSGNAMAEISNAGMRAKGQEKRQTVMRHGFSRLAKRSL